MSIGTTVCWPTGDRRYGWGVIERIANGVATVRFWPWLFQIPLNELQEVKS